MERNADGALGLVVSVPGGEHLWQLDEYKPHLLTDAHDAAVSRQSAYEARPRQRRKGVSVAWRVTTTLPAFHEPSSGWYTASME